MYKNLYNFISYKKFIHKYEKKLFDVFLLKISWKFLVLQITMNNYSILKDI